MGVAMTDSWLALTQPLIQQGQHKIFLLFCCGKAETTAVLENNIWSLQEIISTAMNHFEEYHPQEQPENLMKYMGGSVNDWVALRIL